MNSNEEDTYLLLPYLAEYAALCLRTIRATEGKKSWRKGGFTTQSARGFYFISDCDARHYTLALP